METPDFPTLPGVAGQQEVETLDPSHFYAAYVFNQPETHRDAIATLLEQTQQLGYPVRYWWLSETTELEEDHPDQLLVCVNQPAEDKAAGVDLLVTLHQHIMRPMTWVGLEASALGEYREFGKEIKKPESIYWPDGMSLFPEQSPDNGITETFILIVQDIQAAAQEKLGRDLTDEEVEAVVDSMRKAYDWDFYLGECIRACQDYGKIGPAAPGHIE